MRFSSLFQPAILASVITSSLGQTALASDELDNSMEHLAIFGSAQSLNDLPGSAHLLGQDALEKFDFTDIMRTLTSVPGVYVLEEDGYGLRPNIGMRGTGQNRSDKITIMEDNVLAAPAPYAAPSAYYFPTSGRMQQIEVLKGTSSAMYGPRTTGGVINMLSRQIPSQPLKGQIGLSTGQDGFAKLHAFVGGSGENVASVVEVFRYQADGFKDINYSDQGTGFVKNDLLAKLRLNSDESATYYQELEFKVQYSDEDADETYMGLTEQDFAANPYQRYSASQLDNMDTSHKQIQINHSIALSQNINIGSSIYHNEFSRNWYKASKVGGDSLSSGGIENAAAFDQATNPDSLRVDVKANSRDYISKGLQTVLDAELGDHQLKLGARYHKDEMDRFQWVDKYNLDQDHQMILTQDGAGIAGTDSNRIDSAKALALFIHDEYSQGNLIINAGLRYEDMTIERHDWGKSDVTRSQSPTHKKLDLDVWLPSLALSYKLSQEMVVLAGIQKGFAPPAPGNEQSDNEESINYELGLRYSQDTIHLETIAFFSDYSNMHGNCTASQGCSDDNIGDQFNAGEVEVQGLEFKAGYEHSLGQLKLPIDITYTHTETEFLNAFSSKFDTWGSVQAGNEMPYVPKNQLQISLGLVGQDWSGDLIVRYMDEMRTKVGIGSITSDEIVKSRTVLDLSTKYDLGNKGLLTLSVDNLLDKQYMSTRTHGSIMVGKPRSVTLGYKYSF